jgi:hypothetical protein
VCLSVCVHVYCSCHQSVSVLFKCFSAVCVCMYIMCMFVVRMPSSGVTETSILFKCRNIIKDYDVKGMIGSRDARTGLYKSDGRAIPVSLQVGA